MPNGDPVARLRDAKLRNGRRKEPMELPRSDPLRFLSADPGAPQCAFPHPSAGPSRAHRPQLSAPGARGGLKFAPAGGAAARRAIGGARLICIDASAGRRSAPAAAFIGSAAPLSSAGAARAGWGEREGWGGDGRLWAGGGGGAPPHRYNQRRARSRRRHFPAARDAGHTALGIRAVAAAALSVEMGR